MPVELSLPTRLMIEGITRCGVTVVEAAGNGACPLDDILRKPDGAACEPVFDRSRCDSGALLVGAGRADDSTRLPSSNFGTRVDLHSWGELVTTLGYGDLGVNAAPEKQYTGLFSGTSAATAIVAGAAARLAGQLPAGDGNAAFTLRSLLVDTGVRGAPSPDIGPLPDLKAALQEVKRLAEQPAAAREVTPRCPAPSSPSPPAPPEPAAPRDSYGQPPASPAPSPGDRTRRP